MTNSQTTSVIALVATIVSAVCAAILPHFEQLGPGLKFWGTIVAIIGAAAGSVVMVLNQSLSPGHVSIPIERAAELGLIKPSSE